jgi:hypothetical protein
MPTDSPADLLRPVTHPVAARRILRLALGTSLCLLAAQLINFPLSFVAAVLTMFILALPLPAPGLEQGVKFVIALLAPMLAGMWLLPFLDNARWAGVGLVALALFYSFYYTARGGSPVLGTFMTLGLTLVVTIGSVSPDILLLLIRGLGACAAFAILFVWIAHALLPELPPDPVLAGRHKPPRPTAPEPAVAARNAARALLIVLPLSLLFLFMSASPSYTVVMIKVASMGQQATVDQSRDMGVSLLWSTIWGGVGAVLGWQLLRIWPSLPIYVLLVALAGLSYGRWIFQGQTMHPKSSMVSYAFLTMLVILGPAVLDLGTGAGAAFWTRLLLFAAIAVYGTVAVAVFDAFWPPRGRGRS